MLAQPILHDLDLSVHCGERIGIHGANGAGKTSLLLLMVGLLCAQTGSIEAFGAVRRRERDFLDVRRRAGLLFQDADDQLFCPTVLEDVCFGPLNLGRDRAQARAIGERTLAALGLTGMEERITHRLSGGEKRLVSLAGVLAMEPDVLLLDEPTSGLDERATERLVATLLDPRSGDGDRLPRLGVPQPAGDPAYPAGAGPTGRRPGRERPGRMSPWTGRTAARGHACAAAPRAPSAFIKAEKPGKLVAMALASSTLTGSRAAAPRTRKAMAIRWSHVHLDWPPPGGGPPAPSMTIQSGAGLDGDTAGREPVGDGSKPVAFLDPKFRQAAHSGPAVGARRGDGEDGKLVDHPRNPFSRDVDAGQGAGLDDEIGDGFAGQLAAVRDLDPPAHFDQGLEQAGAQRIDRRRCQGQAANRAR